MVSRSCKSTARVQKGFGVGADGLGSSCDVVLGLRQGFYRNSSRAQ